MIIYKVTNNINNKIYVGQTINTLEYRRNQHERSINYKNTRNNAFSRALKKYGINNFTWEVIDNADNLDQLNQKEEYWISKLNCLIDSGLGYNIKRGGSNYKHHPTTKVKIGEAQQGSKNHMWGKVGELNPKSKKVINLTDNIIYDSANLCAKVENLNFSHICAVCRGTRATTGGKVFRYLSDEGAPINPNTSIQPNTRGVTNLITGEEFPNCKAAVTSLNKKCASNLSNALKRGNGVCSYGGYLWKYTDLNISIIGTAETSKVSPRKSQMKPVLNVTTGEEFESLISAAKSQDAKSYNYLSILLSRGNGECKWKNQLWKLL